MEPRRSTPVNQSSHLLRLPTEVLHQILSHLDCAALVSLQRTCRRLGECATNDLLWAVLVQRNLPIPTNEFAPFTSWREMYMSYHPYWFLTRNVIWFADVAHIGKLIIARYDPRRGCIEAYRLVAEHGGHSFHTWGWNQDVIIHTFRPTVRLWLDDPVLKLDKFDTTALSGRQGWWEGEVRMSTGSESQSIYSTFFLSKSIAPSLQHKSMALWPPFTIPATDRVRIASHDNFQGWGHKPQKLNEISQETFRVRKWMQFSVGGSAFGVRMGEEVTTYATLHPDLYTPTKKKPYQGIWVGDYAGHGCEFLVVIQKDAVDIQVPEPSAAYGDMMDAETAWNAPERPENEDSLRVRVENVTNPSNPAADDGLHSGSLEAIKLTGDPNVPRGEYTFVADDIGPKGFIRVAEDEWFKGARIVKSRGHVAARGFTNDEFLPSQLILMSPNKLAQYWVPFGHISFYERVNIEQLIRS